MVSGRSLPSALAMFCLLAAVGCSGGGSADEVPPDAGSTSTPVDDTSTTTESTEELVAEFDTLDADEQEQRAAEVDLELERATWVVSGLEEAVGVEQADETFDSVNAGVRAELAAVGAQMGGIAAFGTGAPSRLDELSEAQGASLFGAAMISSLGADAAAGLVDGVHTGSGTTPEGVTMSATKDTGTMSLQVTKTINGVDVTVGTTVQVSPCPDATGKALAEGSMSASASMGGVGHSFTYAAKVEIQVDDDAEVASTIETFTAEQGDVSGGKEQYVAVSIEADGDHTVTHQRGDLSADYVQKAVNGSRIMSMLLASRLVRAAETAWKSGRCVKLVPTVSDGPSGLRPSAAVDITAAPRSVMDGSPTGGTVTATLAGGGAAVAPAGTKVKADASFTYTAPPEVEKTGDVTFEARSRRGVATAALHFDTYPLSFTAEGGGGDFRGDGVICDLREPFTISGTGLTLTFAPTDQFRGSYKLSGNAAGVAWSGSGTYKVKLNSYQNGGTLKTVGTNTISSPVGEFTDEAEAKFKLDSVRPC